MNPAPKTPPPPTRLQIGNTPSVIALGVGVLALVVLCWGFRIDPARAFHSYLTAYAFVLSMVVGCLGFVMIAHAANTTWPVGLRRVPEAVASTLPMLGVLFLPLLFGIRPLYPWARASEYSGHLRDLIAHREPFMNPVFFAVRAACYLAFWSVLAWSLRRASFGLETAVDPLSSTRRMRAISYAGLPLLTLTSGFAGFEWFMSLSPDFASTMFGAIWIALCLFGGIASIIVLAGIGQRKNALPIGPSHYSALGRLLLAFLVFLGYVEFFQFLLCWIGNLPSEANWYALRARGVYAYSSAFLIFGHFFLPFFALLSYRLKRRIEPLMWVAAWCLFSLYLHVHWLITPNSKEAGFSWFDLIALVAVIAPTLSVGMWLQRGLPLAAASDPRYSASFAYESR